MPRKADLERGMKVLDIGTGAGDLAFMAAEMVGPTGSVVGPDQDPRGIATEEEVGIDTLAERLRDENVAADGVAKAPDLLGAWARMT